MRSVAVPAAGGDRSGDVVPPLRRSARLRSAADAAPAPAARALAVLPFFFSKLTKREKKELVERLSKLRLLVEIISAAIR